ncbi:MAG: DUF3619 family protein [Burkholderiales bacterium]|nr:DUF3619 family protein [Ferrovum sp.]
MNEFDIAQRIARRLDQGVRELDPAVVNRLHEARFAALSRVPVKQLRLAAATHGHGHTGWDNQQHPFLRATLAALMVAIAIVALNYWQQDQDGDEDNGQLDAKLLSSEIPPQAFAQKDFGAWLQETR